MIVLFLQLSEPLTSNVIHPFAPQLIRDIGITHGNESKVGYYVGMLHSLFFLTEAITVLYWSRTSDRMGRKPIILLGLFGLSVSMYFFGLSRSFTSLVLSRSLNGALNGNVGVLKSMVAEMTDSTNIAEAYAYMPLSWSSGGTLGPMIGGFLSRPADQFPKLFGQSEFHRKYPYFLACSVPATFTAVAWLVTFLFLKETNEKAIGMKQYIMDLFRRTRSDGPLLTSKKTPRLSVDQTIDPIIRSSTHSVSPSQSSSTDSLYKADNKVLITTTVVEVDLPTPSNSSTISVDDDDQQKEQTLPLRAILTRPVIISAGNYATLSLIDIAFRSIQPVFLSTPIEMGGLGLQPATIGNLLSVFGVLNGIVQVFFFARIHDYWGPKKLFVFGVASALPLFIFFPFINAAARSDIGIGFRSGELLAGLNNGIITPHADRSSELGMLVWVLVYAQVVLSVGICLSYGAVFIFIAAASPNKASLGATNGLSQTTVSIMRALGPAIATSMFSVTMEHHYLYGQLVYAVLFVIGLGCVYCGSFLPERI